MFFKHFASKNQLPGFYISETLVENGLKNFFINDFSLFLIFWKVMGNKRNPSIWKGIYKFSLMIHKRSAALDLNIKI